MFGPLAPLHRRACLCTRRR